MSEKITERNAIIDSVTIQIERGTLTAWVGLDYGGSGQGFGGYALYLPESFRHSDRSSPATGHFIWRVLRVAGVDRWSAVKGKSVRVRHSHGKVHAIGHITKDDWFCPAEDFAEMAPEVAQ